ncbi:hypothetical protein ACFV0L_18680 [Streptosporangium canum]|uniref:hypothetical protein n=1 Tax=Streptosporangium canum TaxID=324952 RepID=UPI003699B141
MQLSINPADIFDSIESVSIKHPKTFTRMGVSRPIGFVILGQAATGRLDELAASENEASTADRILTGDEIAGLPAECVATLGTGKAARKFTTYALIGAHVAAVLEFGKATIIELGKVPGTSAATVQKLLAELPSMTEYRKEIEARRKAAAKRAADVAAVRLVWRFAEKFKAPHTEETYAEVMDERGLTYDQVSEIIAALVVEAEIKTAEQVADEVKADA